jgi:hypothetical protein
MAITDFSLNCNSNRVELVSLAFLENSLAGFRPSAEFMRSAFDPLGFTGHLIQG